MNSHSQFGVNLLTCLQVGLTVITVGEGPIVDHGEALLCFCSQPLLHPTVILL